MKKIYLVCIVLPLMNVLSADHAKKTVVRQGIVQRIDWARPELARNIKDKFYMDDVEWLNLALGKKVDPRTPMVYVFITDRASRKYWHLHMNFKHPNEADKEIFFPRWLPRSWFLRPVNGVVKPPRLFGALYELIYVPRPAMPQPPIPTVHDDEKEEGEISGDDA